MMRYTGLIGHHLKHSISAAFQQAAFDHCGLEMRYELWDTDGHDLPAVVEKLRRSDHCGANVTIPHKEKVMALVDHVDKTAGDIGAVNTIVNCDGMLSGCNTDVTGFLRALHDDAAFSVEGKHAVVAGAGGVARAACYGLVVSRVASLTILNRSFLRAQELAASLARIALENKISVKISAAALSGGDYALPPCQLLVNATSIGMRYSPLENESPVSPAAIPKDALVYDLVYNPVETVLLKQAESAGAKTLGGLPMLVYQGAAAFELWTGKKAPVDVMTKAAEKALMSR